MNNKHAEALNDGQTSSLPVTRMNEENNKNRQQQKARGDEETEVLTMVNSC